MNNALIELVPAIILFCLISTITPGPNNILLAHSGAHFGLRKTLPHVMGIRCGMTILHLTILLGLSELFKHWPYMHKAFTVIAASYIVYMSIKIALSKMQSSNKDLQPISTIQAACFQLINPKSWATLITISTVFTLSGDLFWPSAILGILIVNVATLPGSFMWITIGKLVSHKLQQPKFHRYFNVTMGLLLLSTLPMMFI
ncbi:LysE family translocator [Marinomonas sp. 15G1-11]|uniref:LysE family translocator n=1 Tax=Marinomonas phaeophyticola TaxID=3004091 RepID=A0ABT4JWF4_9GAMM|nr:LysE family translocator [Marinomonas sp. 15G1-11]MCZ2722710.1 LysE family translocator [Marinomonas sp. 15G1-11]